MVVSLDEFTKELFEFLKSLARNPRIDNETKVQIYNKGTELILKLGEIYGANIKSNRV